MVIVPFAILSHVIIVFDFIYFNLSNKRKKAGNHNRVNAMNCLLLI
jgi:hypothetical protein